MDFLTNQSHFRKMKDKKSHCLANLAIKLCDFKMDLIKWQLNFGSGNFGLKSILWFQIELVWQSLDFEITRMISDQIALYSVHLPLLICWKNTQRIRKSLVCGSRFTNSTHVLPTSHVVYQPINHRNLWSIAWLYYCLPLLVSALL